MKIFTLIFLFFFGLCSQASATPLSTAAAALAPGQWVKVPMANINITGAYPAWDPGGNNGPGFDSWQPAWDSTARKLYIETAEHNISTFCPGSFPNYPHVCFKPMWTYDDATDRWDIGATGTTSVTVTGVYPNDGAGNPVNTFHAWNLPAWDNVNKVLYLGGSYNLPSQGYRYCVSNTTPSWCVGKGGIWTKLPAGPSERAGNSPQAAVFHEALNAGTGGTLLYYDGDGYGPSCGGLYGYRESTGTWSVIREADCSTSSGIPSISHNTLAFYSHVKQIAVFGGGSIFYKIDNVGTITRLDNSPFVLNTTNPGFAMPSEDPVSGDFYIIASKNPSQLIKLNPTATTGSQWTTIDANLNSVGKVCNILRDTNAECALDVYATPISTYGVIGYWKFLRGTPNSAEFWIYKASTGGGGDITPPVVSITVPSAGATVSGAAVTLTATASDNIGVVGVQFKIDGVATGTEDTASPFSITWNSTGATNGSHTITATARDAAGNSTTSTGVSVTVSNAGGADFATRCNGPGVIFCNGFDTNADLGGDGWGSARGRAPADSIHQFCSQGSNLCPTIDTTDKISGAGSLKFTIPPGQGGGAAGSYWANPAADFSIRFGANQTYYVQFRQKISASYFPAILNGGNNKIHWISSRPDLPGCNTSDTTNCFSSCSENEFVNQNLYGVAANAVPRWYNGCPGPQSFQYIEAVTPGTWKLQNARTGVGCTYDNVNAGNIFPPSGNCFGYHPDQWVTYSYKIALGSLGTGPTGGLCYDDGNRGAIGTNLPSCYYGGQILLRMGLDGQPLEDVLDWRGPVVAKYLTDTVELKYGKVYWSPYTGSSTIPTGATMSFDELIISTQPIPDPGAAPDTTIPTVAITNPIPPTSSTTTSPITVSGTASDNISVTSVTWTCIQCVTKGGTATSSPGTSISWTIPTLDLTSGSNTLNVVAHDAAGNVSTAATLAITYTPNTTYWVRPTGTMSGCTASGTAPTTDAGYKSTITAGVNCMAAGNRLVIRAGTYNERLDEDAGGITYPRATSWGGASIIEALAGETVTVLPQTANGNAVIRTASTGTNYYLWFVGHNRNFIIDGTNVTTGMSVIKIQSPFVRLDSMDIKNGQTANGGNGVMVVEPSLGAEILNSNIHNNGIVGDVNAQSYGIYYQTQNGIITGNDIHDNTGYGIQIYRSGGTPPASNTFANNRVYNNGCTTNIGAVTVMGQNHKVYNNIIYNNCGRNLEAYYYTDNAGTVFYNNTLYGNTNADFALFLNNGVTAKNNISSNNAGALVAGPTNGGTDSNGSGSTTVADHNLCSSTCEFGSSNVTDTAANTFVNAAAANFHLGPKSLAHDAGVSNLGSPYNIDFDGLPRTSPWDIGAYEFVASGPSPVVTIVNPTSNPTLSVTQPLFSLGGTSNLP